MNIERNKFALLEKDLKNVSEETAHLATLKSKNYISWQLHTYTVEIEKGMPEKSSPGTKQTDGKNLVWFGEIERKLAKLSMPIVLLPETYTLISN